MKIKEMIQLFRAIWAARKIQTYLWGEVDGDWVIDEWRKMFRKRVVKLDEISTDNIHWHVEFRKRLLQQAALSIALMSILNKVYRIELVTSLPQYAEKLKED